MVLPYADLTLLSVNSIAGIIFASGMAMVWLNETWITKYDLSSFLFIVLGCGSIVILSDKTQVEFNSDMVKKMLMSLKTILYLTVCCVVVVFDYWLLKVMLKKLREFE